jgi:oligopeptidase A
MNNQLLTCHLNELDIDFKKLKAKDFINAFETLLPLVEGEYIEGKLKATTYEELKENFPINSRVDYIEDLLYALISITGDKKLEKVQEKWSTVIHDLNSKLLFNKDVFNRYVWYTTTESFKALDITKQKELERNIENVKMLGIDLDQQEKEKLIELGAEEISLSQNFESNVADSEDEMIMDVSLSELKGCSKRVIDNARELAKQNGRKGYQISEISGLYDDVLASCENGELRKEIYIQRLNRCKLGEFANLELANRIVKIKQEKAKILKFNNFAQLTMHHNMVKDPIKAIDFLNCLGSDSLESAKKEFKELTDFGINYLGKKLDHWDYGLVIQKCQEDKYNLNHEKIREYFPVNHVFNNLLEFCSELFDLKFEEVNSNLWHEDAVKYNVFSIQKGQKELIGVLFVDLYARDGKRPGAWAEGVLNRNVQSNGVLTLPHVFLVCNCSKDLVGDSTMAFHDVLTMFHEMGHALHQLLSKVDTDFFSGIDSVEHDAVELPSQLMENFCYDFNVLNKITKHVKTGNPLPLEQFNKLIQARKFLGATTINEYVRYSLADMELHIQNKKTPLEIEMEINEKWKVSDTYDIDDVRMPTFLHLFANSYAAGYYAYQWAEVLAADAYEAFKEAINDPKQLREVANSYRKNILETGGVGSMADKFLAFRGHEPDVKYLLESYGIKNSVLKTKKI